MNVNTSGFSFKNSEGYPDPTPYRATNKRTFKRGEIYYINGRPNPSIIVSGEHRETDILQSIVDIFYTKKHDSDVEIVTKEGIGYVNTNAVKFVSEQYIEDFIKLVSDKEMEALDRALIKSLGLSHTDSAPENRFIAVEPEDNMCDEYIEMQNDLVQAKAEAKVYKDMYEHLLERMVR